MFTLITSTSNATSVFTSATDVTFSSSTFSPSSSYLPISVTSSAGTSNPASPISTLPLFQHLDPLQFMRLYFVLFPFLF
jgi:hypothetical protein